MPLVLASRLFATPLPERVVTTDLFDDVAELAQERGGRFYFLGAGASVMEEAIRIVRRLFPDLRSPAIALTTSRSQTRPRHRCHRCSVSRHSVAWHGRAYRTILRVAQPRPAAWRRRDRRRERIVRLSVRLGERCRSIANRSRPRQPSFELASLCMRRLSHSSDFSKPYMTAPTTTASQNLAITHDGLGPRTERRPPRSGCISASRPVLIQYSREINHDSERQSSHLGLLQQSRTRIARSLRIDRFLRFSCGFFLNSCPIRRRALPRCNTNGCPNVTPR